MPAGYFESLPVCVLFPRHRGRNYNIRSKIISFAMGDIDSGLKKFCLEQSHLLIRVAFSVQAGISTVHVLPSPLLCLSKKHSER